jgi:hypothetical protein
MHPKKTLRPELFEPNKQAFITQTHRRKDVTCDLRCKKRREGLRVLVTEKTGPCARAQAAVNTANVVE